MLSCPCSFRRCVRIKSRQFFQKADLYLPLVHEEAVADLPHLGRQGHELLLLLTVRWDERSGGGRWRELSSVAVIVSPGVRPVSWSVGGATQQCCVEGDGLTRVSLHPSAPGPGSSRGPRCHPPHSGPVVEGGLLVSSPGHHAAELPSLPSALDYLGPVEWPAARSAKVRAGVGVGVEGLYQLTTMVYRPTIFASSSLLPSRVKDTSFCSGSKGGIASVAVSPSYRGCVSPVR